MVAKRTFHAERLSSALLNGRYPREDPFFKIVEMPATPQTPQDRRPAMVVVVKKRKT